MWCACKILLANFTHGAKVRDGDAQISVSKLIRQGENNSDEDGKREKKGVGYAGQRIERERSKSTEILPRVTNALPRGGEVSSMFMPRISGLPIVPNRPRPRCAIGFVPLLYRLARKSPHQDCPLSFLPIRSCDLRTYFVPSKVAKDRTETLIGNSAGRTSSWALIGDNIR